MLTCRHFLYACFALVSGAGILAAQDHVETNTAPTLVTKTATLTFPQTDTGGYGVRLHQVGDGGMDAYAAGPVQMLVCGPCTDESVDLPFAAVSYSTIAKHEGDIEASASFTSPKGSKFQITDVYSVAGRGEPVGGSFIVRRDVVVLTAAEEDEGFNSQFLLGFQRPVNLEKYHLFAPAIWYDHNANSAQGGGFGTNTLNSYFFWRETRSALPLMMIQDPQTGSALSIAHIESVPQPGKAIRNAGWMIDPTVQSGSIGVQKIPSVAIGFIYPSSEGDGSYLSRKSFLSNGQASNWVRRSHPVAKNVSHTYTLMLSLDRFTSPNGNADFKRAMAATWSMYYRVFNPPTAKVPGDAVYQSGINLLNGYVETVNGATGLPFGRPLSASETPANNPVYEMGYVGEQIPLGYQLYRYGVLHNDEKSLSHGKAMLDFWAVRARQPSGLPLAVYHANDRAFQTLGGPCPYPLFTRLVSDGMEGMVLAAVFARQYHEPQRAWEAFSQGYGDWLVGHQNDDGSFYRAYNPDGSVYNKGCLAQDPYSASKVNTPDVVRFLVELYFATGSQKYLAAAQRAGRFSLATIYGPMQYLGGTIDNPNVIDKVAGVEALHAALALLDAAIAQGDQADQKIWLQASQEAADYSKTWAYAWDFPIGLPEGTQPSGAYASYKFAGTKAVGIIATGQSSADISLSYESFDYFRLFLFQHEENPNDPAGVGDLDLQTANQFWNNTKLTTQLAGVPSQQFGYAKDGLVGEGVDLSQQLYGGAKSSQTWLPWLTNAEIDPIQRFQDAFNIAAPFAAQPSGLSRLQAANRHIYPSPGSIGWGQ